MTQSLRFAGELIAVMRSFKLNARMTDRKNDYIVYIKGGDDVSSFLQIVGAANSYMDFESVRVVKDMRNRVNRQVNCETANLQKSVDAAVRQMRDVEKLLQYKRLSELSPSVRAACEARMKNPDASMAELADLCGITKSGLAHRVRKIASMAETLDVHMRQVWSWPASIFSSMLIEAWGSSFFILCPTTMNSSISKKRGSAPCAHPPLKADKILNASKVFFNVKSSL